MRPTPQAHEKISTDKGTRYHHDLKYLSRDEIGNLSVKRALRRDVHDHTKCDRRDKDRKKKKEKHFRYLSYRAPDFPIQHKRIK